MKIFKYKIYPNKEIKSIVADDEKDAVRRICKIERCHERRVDLLDQENVSFENKNSHKRERRHGIRV